jgi:hypothetical protein
LDNGVDNVQENGELALTTRTVVLRELIAVVESQSRQVVENNLDWDYVIPTVASRQVRRDAVKDPLECRHVAFQAENVGIRLGMLSGFVLNCPIAPTDTRGMEKVVILPFMVLGEQTMRIWFAAHI